MKNKWKACRSLFRIRLTEGLQYRLAGLSGATITLFWALIEIIVFRVFYTYGDPGAIGASAMTLAQVVSYVWIGQAMVAVMPMGVDGDILTKIVNGDVGVELCRPLDLYSHWFFRYAAGKVSQFCLRSGPLLLAAVLLPAPFGLGLPHSLMGFMLFILSMGSAFLLSSAFGILLCVMRLGVEWGDGPVGMVSVLGQILSGVYIPLRLWPEILQPFLLIQPFAGYVDIPARLFTGVLLPQDALGPILLQLGWTAAILFSGRRLMRHKLKHLIVQGG